jgi:peptidoglycan hydrolase CwlO-like protein
MTISIDTILTFLTVAGAIAGWFYAIKKIGAAEMKTTKEIERLEADVSDLKNRINTVESCGNDNDKAIGEIKIDLEWIKEGIREIKKLLGEKS